MRVYLVHAAGAAFSFAVLATLSSVYRFQQVGLTPLQLVLVGTVLEATVLLAELPTGVLADTVSRRLSVIAGAVLIGLGFVLEGLVPVWGAVLLAQVVWGLGAAFESGALEAWLSDEIGEQPASRAFLRAAQVRQVAALAGIPVAALLGRIGLGWPLVVGGAGFLVLAAFLTVSMSETGFAPVGAGDRHPLRAIAGTLRRGVALGRARPLVWSILAVALVAGASSETFDRLWEAQMIAGPGLPARIGAPVWFALVAVATAALGVAAAEVARRALRRHDAEGRARRPLVALLLALTLVQGVAVAGFGLAGRLDLALATYLLARVAGGVRVPLYAAWLNRELEPATRATAFSAAGVADALGQVMGGPLLGLVAVALGMPAAFVLAGMLLAPAAWLMARVWRREPPWAAPRA